MHPLDVHLRARLAALTGARSAGPGSGPAGHPPADGSLPVGSAAATAHWWQVFEAQAISRHLDFIARELQQQGRGYYTIGSAGHEANALVAYATRASDPALLHYRSGAFYAARAQRVPGSTSVRDVLQGLMALAAEPIAGGRHKVFGHPDLSIIPQTSTIASHLPRAVGLAIMLHRARRLGVAGEWPADSVVVCSFGDASANHSTAVGAINSAINAGYRGLPVPVLFVCEDNDFGISVATPPGWIATAYGARPGLDYVYADSDDPVGAATLIGDLVDRVRERRSPGFLHLKTVRFLGHAGSDAEVSYRKPREIEADYARDPLLATASVLIAGGAGAEEVVDRYLSARRLIDLEVGRLDGQPGLASAEEVMAPIARRRPERVRVRAATLQVTTETSITDALAPEPRRTLAESINATLSAILAAEPEVMVFGEDVGVKGGVYGVTRGLARHHGSARVFDTILDEQSILGLALGAGLAGLIPIPEIQYLAYLHNAEDQLRGEAATLPFFSQGRFNNPMVIRIAGLSYQKGFGGHFHNDNAPGVLLDIPGVVVACPSRGDDAAAMLRTLVAAAIEDATVSVFLEPIALYHRRDLHEPGDDGWLAGDDRSEAPIGSARLYPATTEPDLVMVTFGNGVPMTLRVARRLGDRGIHAEVLDLRWLAPLPVDDLLAAARRAGRVLVVDETRRTGGVGQAVVTALVEAGYRGSIVRVASRDSFLPLGAATRHVLLGEDDIESAAITVAGEERR